MQSWWVLCTLACLCVFVDATPLALSWCSLTYGLLGSAVQEVGHLVAHPLLATPAQLVQQQHRLHQHQLKTAMCVCLVGAPPTAQKTILQPFAPLAATQHTPQAAPLDPASPVPRATLVQHSLPIPEHAILYGPLLPRIAALQSQHHC